MPFFFLGSAEGKLIGIAVLDACLPESDARGPFFGLGSGKITVKIAEMLHLFGQYIGKFLGHIWIFVTDTPVHKA